MTARRATKRRAPSTPPPRIALELSSSDIDLLDERGLIDTLNFLVREEAVHVGIPLTSLILSGNEKAPDDGIDAKVDSSAKSDWIPTGISIWQFKAYDVTPAEIRRELSAANRG